VRAPLACTLAVACGDLPGPADGGIRTGERGYGLGDESAPADQTAWSDVVDLLHAYSNRTDLLVDLEEAARRLGQALGSTESDQARSVRTLAPGFRKRQVAYRLGEVAVAQLVARFGAGTAKHKLAEEYGISLSSVKRLLRAESAKRQD
jgi:hypothetical protein